MEGNETIVLKLLEGIFGVCKLGAKDEIPTWVNGDKFISITRTEEEMSIVCEENNIPQNVVYEPDWRILKIEGILDFSMIGIIAKISSILAEKGISIFVISTFNTDYILIKEKNINNAIEVLEERNYNIKI